MSNNTLSRRPAQLRQAAEGQGTGWLQLVNGVQPAAGASFTRTVPGEFWERLLTISFTLVTSAAAGGRQLLLNFMDGDGNIFNQTFLAGNVGPSITLSEYGDQANTQIGQVVQQAFGEGSVTSPAAGATIASVPAASLPAGEYIIGVNLNLAGTVAQAVDANNLEIVFGATTEILDNTIAAGPQPFGPYTMQTAGGNVLSVKAIGAATAGAIYSATVTAAAVLQQNEFTFPDLVLKSGWQVGIQCLGIAAGDQISNVRLLLERYPSGDQLLRDAGAMNELARRLLDVLAG
jgi:hypothetical protein